MDLNEEYNLIICCSVPGCLMNASTYSTRVLFMIPDDERREDWILYCQRVGMAINNEILDPSSFAFVCSNHFRKDQFYTEGLILCENAVPCINPCLALEPYNELSCFLTFNAQQFDVTTTSQTEAPHDETTTEDKLITIDHSVISQLGVSDHISVDSEDRPPSIVPTIEQEPLIYRGVPIQITPEPPIFLLKRPAERIQTPSHSGNSPWITKVYKCDKCCKDLVGFSQLLTHCLEHYSRGNYECILCHSLLTTDYHLTLHLVRHECSIDDSPPRTEYEESEDSFTFECMLPSPIRVTPSKSRKVTFLPEENKFLCDVCHDKFSDELGLISHFSSYHPIDDYHCCCMCNACCEIFPSISTVLIHYLAHHEESKQISVGQVSQIYDYVVIPRLYVCEFCEKCFAFGVHLNDHRVEVHAKSDMKYCCKYCTFKTSNYKRFCEHKRRHQGQETLSEYHDKLLVPMTWLCKFCNQFFTDRNNYKSHLKAHVGETPYTCRYCLVSCARYNEMKEHRQTHICQDPYSPIVSERNFPCAYCHKTYVNKKSFVKHTQIHLDENTAFICGTCGINFISKNLLYTHTNTHSKVQLHSCSMCPAKFKRLTYFKNHLERHSKEIRKCQICSIMFPSNFLLKQHIKSSHAGLVYRCFVCNASFSHFSHLKQHRKIHARPRRKTAIT